MITLTIPRITPSLNQLVRMHWAARMRLDAIWALEVAVAISEAGWQPERPAPWMGVVVRSFRKALLDYDNLVGGAKPLLDALQVAGAIRNDSAAWVDVSYEQQIGKPRRTVIELQAGEGMPV